MTGEGINRKCVDKNGNLCYEIKNVDFVIVIQTVTKFTGKVVLEFNQGGVSKIEKQEILK